MAVFLTLALFLKYVVPSFVENSEYKRLDAELKPRLAPLHHLISMCENPEDLKLLGDKVSIELSTFCSEHRELFEDNVKNPSKKFVSHQNKTIAELEALKKVLRKEAFKEGAGEEKRKEFYDTIKAISDLKAKEKFKQDQKTGAFQEKQFKKTSSSLPKKLLMILLERTQSSLHFLSK